MAKMIINIDGQTQEIKIKSPIFKMALWYLDVKIAIAKWLGIYKVENEPTYEERQEFYKFIQEELDNEGPEDWKQNKQDEQAAQ